jgi:hypothetical protein
MKLQMLGRGTSAAAIPTTSPTLPMSGEHGVRADVTVT